MIYQQRHIELIYVQALHDIKKATILYETLIQKASSINVKKLLENKLANNPPKNPKTIATINFAFAKKLFR